LSVAEATQGQSVESPSLPDPHSHTVGIFRPLNFLYVSHPGASRLSSTNLTTAPGGAITWLRATASRLLPLGAGFSTLTTAELHFARATLSVSVRGRICRSTDSRPEGGDWLLGRSSRLGSSKGRLCDPTGKASRHPKVPLAARFSRSRPELSDPRIQRVKAVS
jgi:hypothetical protein